MEVIQWTALWSTFKDEFENEKNMLGGSLGDKAAEDLRLRVIEHVIMISSVFIFNSCHVVTLLILIPISDVSVTCYYMLWFIVCFLNEIVVTCFLDFTLQNILVVSKYYSRITLNRLSNLLCLTIQVCCLNYTILES